VLQILAACCSVLQCVAVRCSVLQCVLQCVLLCVAVYHNVLQCVAVYCSVLQCVAAIHESTSRALALVLLHAHAPPQHMSMHPLNTNEFTSLFSTNLVVQMNCLFWSSASSALST